EWISALLDDYRGRRDALTEASFFSVYAGLLGRAPTGEQTAQAAAHKVDPRELPIVRDALASIGEGGYVEALARVAFLLKQKTGPLPLSRLELKQDLVSEYASYLPGMPPNDWRRIRGEQEIIASYEPESAIESLPRLLDDRADRKHLLDLLDKLMADRRVMAT